MQHATKNVHMQHDIPIYKKFSLLACKSVKSSNCENVVPTSVGV